MNVAIIDDEPPAIALLSAYIQRTESLVLQSTFTDPMDAMEDYDHNSPPQLTFLDIDMPAMNGIDFARIIGTKTQIIFTTSFRNFGPEAFELSVCDYLLKPFSFQRFLEAVKKVPTSRSSTPHSADFFFIRTEIRGKYLRVALPDIIFVESEDNLVHITQRSGTLTGMQKLSDIQARLTAGNFSRVHRSYIVNLAEVQAIDHGQLLMSNGKIIPIGRQYKDALMTGIRQLIISGHP